MSKCLSTILKGIDADNDIIEIINQIYINKITVNKNNNKISMYINSIKKINKNEIIKIKKLLAKNYDFQYDIDIVECNKNVSLEEIDKIYFDNILNYISKQIPFANGWIKNSVRTISENRYIFQIENNFGANYLLAKNCDKMIKKYIGENFNNDIIIEIKSLNSNKYFEYHKEKLKEDNNIISELMNNKSDNKYSIKSDTKEISNMIYGKKTDNEIFDIKLINENSGKVTIEGDIFNVELKSTKSGSNILLFSITDYTSSITISIFKGERNKSVFDDVVERIKIGLHCRVKGEAVLDKYTNEVIIRATDIEKCDCIKRVDNSDEKRIELHLHTQMSSMDGMSSVTSLIKTAANWGHKAIAITDHGVVQAFPEAAEASKKYNIKVIYGVEAYLVDDGIKIVSNETDTSIDEEYVCLDIETTGLYQSTNKIIEIGAARIKNGIVTGRFNELINPEINIPDKIVELTGITDEMVKDKRKIHEVLNDLVEFIGNRFIVAHNAKFDMGFINKNLVDIEMKPLNNTIIDTLSLSKQLFRTLKKYKLDNVAKHLNITLENHHRAVDDAECAGYIFYKSIDILKEKGIEKLSDINVLFNGKIDYKKSENYHTIILVKNYTGLLNLYKLISISHLEYYYRKPRILKSILEQYREGLIIGSACEAGLLYKEVLKNTDENTLKDIVRFYDYLEIQPIGNNEFLIRNNTVKNKEELENINKKILELGKKYNKPVVATGDVHFLNPEDEVYRRILMYGQGFEDADEQAPLYFKTTEEMLLEFSYLGIENAKDVVINNPSLISDMIDIIKPIPDETFPPKIDGAEDDIKNMTLKRAHEIYGDILPEIVQKRLDKELNSIISNGYAVLYLIAQKLVHKSISDGYLVGSRGSVGSSFVATMCEITEVNPLPPHYVCTECKYSEFITDGSYGSGVDMPEKNCPNCGEILARDGFDIPFEVFLGFEGDKEPDIDLNFSGEYQPVAHKYTEELFGKGHVFRAGTIGTIAEKTAFGFVKKYIDDKNIVIPKAEIDRLTKGCTGVKRTTGQHPGGVMVVPRDNEIYQFCPIQHPADDTGSEIITTHFDYHSISGRLLKLDILGHDDPTVIKMLQDLSGIDPKAIPLSDEKVLSLFTSPDSLDITKEDIDCEVGTLALPEFGTEFIRPMLLDTQPKTFADLVRISGLSHGTDVWVNNAQNLIKSKTATLKEVIATRDDIMLYLIQKGVKPKNAFNIMERVRKGKGLREDDIKEMKDNNVPEWYIESCNKIKYMFPKGHAVAYVMMAIRIAYFKVYMPIYFYAAYFSIRADEFDSEIIVKGLDSVYRKIKEIVQQGNNATQKDKGLLKILYIAVEMYKRGLSFHKVDLYKSDATKFLIIDNKLLPPLSSLQGLGETAAKNIVEDRKNGIYISIDDLRIRTKISKTVIEILKNHGCLDGIPESSQITLFEL